MNAGWNNPFPRIKSPSDTKSDFLKFLAGVGGVDTSPPLRDLLCRRQVKKGQTQIIYKCILYKCVCGMRCRLGMCVWPRVLHKLYAFQRDTNAHMTRRYSASWCKKYICKVSRIAFCLRLPINFRASAFAALSKWKCLCCFQETWWVLCVFPLPVMVNALMELRTRRSLVSFLSLIIIYTLCVWWAHAGSHSRISALPHSLFLERVHIILLTKR